jgi:glycosyltransferase involved in cell wall biosynthesis
LFKINLRRLEKRINNVLVISPKMKEEYSKENANIRYHVLLNSVNYIKEHVDWQTRNQIIFAYIGGLHLNRWESLLVLEKCISELNKLGINSRIYVYTPENDATLFSEKYNSQYTIFKGFLPHDKIWMAYKNADIFIHIESFNNKVTKYTKYSISTKIPECMAEGKPILCFAPNDLAVAEYINSTKVGISVDNYDDLLEVAINLSTNINLRKELGTNGIKTVMTSHTQDRALKLLVDVLQPEER